MSTAQSFEVERFSRIIDNANDMTALRKLAKILLEAWMTQRAAGEWLMRLMPKASIEPIPPPWDDPLA